MPGITYEAAFMFADLAGYTALTEAHGDLAAADLVAQFTTVVKSALAPGATLVQTIGDEALVKAMHSDALLETALALTSAVDQIVHFPGLHIGLHRGPVIQRNDQYFGSTLNLTSRIAAYAAGGQVLCSGVFREGLTEPAKWAFRSLGPVHFKNYSEAVEVLEVLTGAERYTQVLDPVCRMKVDPANAPARLPYGDQLYYFCSMDCARRFMEKPAQFARQGS